MPLLLRTLNTNRKGNKAFAAKEYDEAIDCYTKAIQKDSKNHVFFSNRSASYIGKKQWEEAISDAKQCIRLNPSFIKGYYRLASAQLENDDLDAAISTIKQGFNIEPGNSQLTKLMRSVKSKKQAKQVAANSTASSGGVDGAGIPMAGNVGGGSGNEILDLQNQLRNTVRDMNIVNANITKAEKEMKMNAITVDELNRLPEEEAHCNMYRGIGKMFMLSSRDEVFEKLEEETKGNKNKIAEMTQKKDYLERRIKSQQQNIMELASSMKSSE